MKVRKHFRTSTSTIDLILADFSFSRISDKDIYLKYCVNKRMQLLNNKYDEKLDRILTYLIRNCNYDGIPLEVLSKIIMSLSKVTNALSKGFISLLS